MVLLLHGMGCNPRTVSLLAKFLHRRLDQSVLALHLGLGLGDLRPTAELLHTRLEPRMRGSRRVFAQVASSLADA